MTSDSYEWEDVEVPRGSFISWGSQPGQEVVGRVLESRPTGGTDFNDEPCPQLVIDLTAPAYSINKDGERFDYDTGDLVTINAGLANLKRAIRTADPEPGDMIRIRFSDTEKASKGTTKIFSIRIARGAGRSSSRPARPQAQAEPPF